MASQIDRVRQTYSDRIYVPGLTKYFKPPIIYRVTSIRIYRANNEVFVKIRILNANEEANEEKVANNE